MRGGTSSREFATRRRLPVGLYTTPIPELRARTGPSESVMMRLGMPVEPVPSGCATRVAVSPLSTEDAQPDPGRRGIDSRLRPVGGRVRFQWKTDAFGTFLSASLDLHAHKAQRQATPVAVVQEEASRTSRTA